MHFSSIRAAGPLMPSLQPFQPFVAHFAWRAAFPHFFTPQGARQRSSQSQPASGLSRWPFTPAAGWLCINVDLFRQNNQAGKSLPFKSMLLIMTDHESGVIVISTRTPRALMSCQLRGARQQSACWLATRSISLAVESPKKHVNLQLQICARG
jgi:hypothetical protein